MSPLAKIQQNQVVDFNAQIKFDLHWQHNWGSAVVSFISFSVSLCIIKFTIGHTHPYVFLHVRCVNERNYCQRYQPTNPKRRLCNRFRSMDPLCHRRKFLRLLQPDINCAFICFTLLLTLNVPSYFSPSQTHNSYHNSLRH